MEQIHARYNRIFAFGVFLVAFIAFFMTVAPTVAFWDCGEYVAAGHSLGVPHPPGNPLFMMMLRVSSILFSFFKDVGYRMNFLVVLFSAATAAVMYLVTVRVSIAFMGQLDTPWKRITAYTGGVVGGLFSVFGTTFWFSAVEASEANPAMFFVALGTYLVITWAQSNDPKRDRILILLTYLSFLGIGIHMYSMIILPSIFLLIMLLDKEKRNDWRMWLTAISIGMVIKDLNLFIYTGIGAFVVTAVMSLLEGTNQKKWRFCFWIVAVAILGFSCHFYIPVRSSVNPIIDENDPETAIAFKEYLERKQYGSEDMFGRMFHRRGSFEHQFGIEGHMGYGGFHITQFYQLSPQDTEKNFFEEGFLTGLSKLFIYLIPTFFMIYGMYYVYRRNKVFGIFLISLFIISSVAMVFYMNFADGTRPELRDYQYWLRNGQQGPMPVVHREVRVRDYFFAAAFMYLGLWMGIAASALMHYLFTSKNSFSRTVLAPVAAVFFFCSPVLPMTQNWEKSTRRGDFVPYDYAYNLLMSCEQDGIIFTNGDNDTFPLWALQEAYGVRKDVRIVNLSLVNTQWYIKQLKTLEPKVPISFSEDQIDQLDHGLNKYEEPFPYKMSGANITVNIPSRKELNIMRVQDIMVVNIVDANKWKKPIYFAVTVSEDNLMGLGPYLKMQGMAYRVMPFQVSEQDRLDIPRTIELIDNVYKYRGLGDGTTHLNDTSEKLLTNYSATFIQVALALRDHLARLKSEIESISAQKPSSQDSLALLTEKKKVYQDTINLAVTELDKCDKMIPGDWRPKVLRHEILMTNDRIEDAENKIREALKAEPKNDQYKKLLIEALQQQPNKKKEAIELLKSSLSTEPDQWFAHASLSKNYQEMGLYDSAKGIMQQFAATHPGDRRATAFIQELDELKKAAETVNKPDSAVNVDSATVKSVSTAKVDTAGKIKVK